MPPKVKQAYKLKRLRDGRVIEYNAAHALEILRANAKFAKSEFELAEKNYIFKENEIQRNTNSQNTGGAEAPGQDN